jgi:hypothetical protein
MPPIPPQNRPWSTFLHPLLWWLALVLVLFGIRTHQRLMEQTRLAFSITMQDQPPFPQATATLDGTPVSNGQKIPLGHHQFTVTHPKGETFSTNLFIWYGAHKLGAINLKRTMGTLSVTADPPADVLVIRGPEWSVVLTNTPGLTQSMPTDAYEVEVRYPHWQRNTTVAVLANQTTPCTIAPHFGGLKLECNQSNATFQLQGTDGQLVADGTLPATVGGLSAGDYHLTATHHGHQRTDSLAVKADTNTSAQIDFQYGTVVFETKPAGATVVTEDGRNWGETPLTRSELQPGNWSFTLQRVGYQSVRVSLNVVANQTSAVNTNLVSENYLHAMTVARQYLADADYDHALQSADDAVAARPGDADAVALQREANGTGIIEHAKRLGKMGDYVSGGKELARALQMLPDNAEATQMALDFKQHVPEQIERQRVERLERGNVAFTNAFADTKDADLFASHEFKTTRPVNEVYPAILDALKMPPAFQISKNFSPAAETFEIEFKQNFSTFLATSAGYRDGVIVCAQTKDDETQILFKILEYKTEAQVKFSLGNMIGAPDAVNFVPISASRLGPLSEKLQARLNEGVTNVTARIQGAIGQIRSSASQ